MLKRNFLNRWNLNYQTWYDDASSWARVIQNDLSAVFKVKVTVKDHISKYDFLISHLNRFATELGLMAHSHKLDSLVNRLDCSVVFEAKVTGKLQNFSECSPWRYLFNCWTFFNQTGYGDASSWARESIVIKEDWFAIFKSRIIVWAHIVMHDSFCRILIYWTADRFAAALNWMEHHHELHELQCF